MGKKSQIDEKKSQIISRQKSFVFCDDHGIFRTHEIDTSLPSIFGPFQLLATKCGGHVFPTTLVSQAYCLQSCSLHEAKLEKSFQVVGHGTITLVSKASFSLNKVGVDFLVTGLQWAYFAYVVRIVGRKKSRESFTRFRAKSKKKKNTTCHFQLFEYAFCSL